MEREATGRIRARVLASIIPILMDYERDGCEEFDPDGPDDAVGRFLDDRLIRFVRAYLHARDPESYYQRDRLVTDPVCGMILKRAEAVGHLEYGGVTYHFCTEGCQQRFQRDPERFLRGSAA